MRVSGKIFRGDRGENLGVEYNLGDWQLQFGPSIGARGFFFVVLINPRGWRTLEWFKTRAEIFAWVETQQTKHGELFAARP